jgi:hypothetical protein
MKQLFIASLIVGLNTVSFAAPIHCFSKDNKTGYTVTLNNQQNQAIVKNNGEEVVFGTLSCYPDDSGNNSQLTYCHSDGVADAGYSAVLKIGTTDLYEMVLSEVSFFGSKQIAELACIAAQN